MKLKGLLKVALVLLAISTMFVACDTLAGGKFPPIFTPFTPEAGTVYVQMPETWLGNKAYGAWIWADGGEGSWYDLDVVDESEGIFSCDVPADKQNIIFVAFTSETKDWANKKEQTADLKVPTDENVLYVIQSSSWVDPTGKAEIPEPPAEPEEPEEPAGPKFYIAGSMNGWNTTANELTDMTYTFFYDGNLSFKILKDSTWYGINGSVDALDTEYKLEDAGNITIPCLEVSYEYVITIIEKDDGIYIKVSATGNQDESLIPDPSVPQGYYKLSHIAGSLDNWSHTKLDENNSVEFTASSDSVEFKFTLGNWDGGDVGGPETTLNKETAIGGSSNIKVTGLTVGTKYKITLTVKDESNATFIVTEA